MSRKRVKKLLKKLFSYHGRRNSHHTLHARFGRVGIDKFAPTVKTRFAWRRGRCLERELRFPITRKWTVQISGRCKTYLELVEGPKYLRNIDWILDEFDSSFNALAVASLRYHLGFSVCNNEHNREVYEDLIARLTERRPTFTDDEMSVLNPQGWEIEDSLKELSGELAHPNPEARDAIYEAQWQRGSEYRDRIQKARHDFVDIMPGLWS